MGWGPFHVSLRPNPYEIRSLCCLVLCFEIAVLSSPVAGLSLTLFSKVALFSSIAGLPTGRQTYKLLAALQVVNFPFAQLALTKLLAARGQVRLRPHRPTTTLSRLWDAKPVPARAERCYAASLCTLREGQRNSISETTRNTQKRNLRGFRVVEMW